MHYQFYQHLIYAGAQLVYRQPFTDTQNQSVKC